MKFMVSMKDPDALYEPIEKAVRQSLIGMEITEEEREELAEIRAEKVRNLCGKWFEHGEYLVVQIDTEQMTCEVVPNR